MVQELRDTATPAEEAHFLTPSLEDDADDVLDTSEVPDLPLQERIDAAQGSQEQQAQVHVAPAEVAASLPAPADHPHDESNIQYVKEFESISPRDMRRDLIGVFENRRVTKGPQKNYKYTGRFGAVKLHEGMQENRVPLIGYIKRKGVRVGIGHSYAKIISKLELGSERAQHIKMAKALLSVTPDLEGYGVTQRDAMAMLDTIANISEPTRKKGADILYRAFLRLVADPGSNVYLKLNDLEKYFHFARSVKSGLGEQKGLGGAMAGRRQVVSFIVYAIAEGMVDYEEGKVRKRVSALEPSTAIEMLANYVSDHEIGDYFSSPEEMKSLALAQPRYAYTDKTLLALKDNGMIDDALYSALVIEGAKKKYRKKKRQMGKRTNAAEQDSGSAQSATRSSEIWGGRLRSRGPKDSKIASEVFGRASQTISARHLAQVQQVQAQIESIMGMESSSSSEPGDT